MIIKRFLVATFLFIAGSIGAQAQTSDFAGVGAEVGDQSTPPVPEGKLPDTVQPVAYRLDLTVDPSRERFSGKVEIDVDLREPARRLVLHGRDLAMHSAAARLDGETISGTWRQVHRTGVAALAFPRTIPAGRVTLSFDYDAAFNDGPAGMFRVKVGEDWYSWTQFQSIDARAAFPSFDQPSFKTPFTVTLRTPPGLTAISNAPQIAERNEGALTVHRFEPTAPLPTYLVAFMVGPFTMIESEVAPTPQRERPLPLRIVSTRPNAGKLDYAMQGSKEIVKLLEDYFADSFPYPKLDQITSPVMPGAMENAGADLYRDALIVMDANAPTPQQRRFGVVVAHELAHQWFGDLVTPAWWDDIWLNESFANWMGYRIGDAWHPELNIGGGALAEGFAAMDTDALIAGRPIREPIESETQIDGAFDSITYGKGGHVVAMIAAFMGDETFRDGVRRYLAQHRHGTATSTEFFAALAQQAGDPRIVPAMQSFIGQQGVPLLTFQREDDGYRVTQSRYAPFGVTPPRSTWGIPMCVRRGDERFCRLMTEKTEMLSLDGSGPIMPNAGGTGYYRFELSNRDWNKLIRRAEQLPGGEAQALADSLSASILAGLAEVRQLAKLARRLVRHPDTYASDAATEELTRLVTSGVVDSRGRSAWRSFRGRLYRPLLSDLDFDPRDGAYAGENPERSQRRAQAVDRLLGSNRDGDLRKALAQAAERYLNGDAGALDPAWFGPAFEVHIDRGGDEAAHTLVARALASEDPVFRPAALYAVASSGHESIARWVLEELDDARLRPSEQRDMLRGIMYNRATQDLGYEWIGRNIDQLTAGRAGIFFAARLPQLFARFCSRDRAAELAKRFRPRFAGKSGELELERTIERVNNCGVLRDGLGREISEGFSELN